MESPYSIPSWLYIGITTCILLLLSPHAYSYESNCPEKRYGVSDSTDNRTTQTLPSTSIYYSEELTTLPGMENMSDLFDLESGAQVVSQQPDLIGPGGFEGSRQFVRTRDQSLTSMHLRGGRTNQVQYLIEGSSIQHPVYGGRSLYDLTLSSIESVTLYKGVAPARYGQAQSGIVNIQMRDGSTGKNDSFTFKTTYKTGYDQFGGDSFNRNRFTFFAGDIFSDIDKLQLSFSGGFDLSDTPYHMGQTRKDFTVLVIPLNGRQQNRSHLNLIADYQPAPKHNLRFIYNGYWSQWNEFSWLWKNTPEQLADFDRRTHHANLEYSYEWKQKSRFEFSYSHLNNRYHASVDGRTPPDYWRKIGTPDMRSIVEPIHFSTTESPGFVDPAAVQDIWHNEEIAVNTFRARGNTVLFSKHQIEVGMGLKFYDLDFTDIIEGGSVLSDYGRQLAGKEFPKELPPPPGPYKRFGSDRSHFTVNPAKYYGYLQYRLNLEFLKIRAGLRSDWFNRGSTVTQRSYQTILSRALGYFPSPLFNPMSNIERTSYALSPRATLLFPYNHSTFYFAYGQFNQMPELQYLYRDPHSSGLVGNPRLDYINTELFEFGLNQTITDQLNITVNSYFKDVDGLPSNFETPNPYGLVTTYLENHGQSRIWGSEFSLQYSPGPYLRIKGNYTLQWANGSLLSDEEYNLFDTPQNRYLTDISQQILLNNPQRPLNWNARHRSVIRTTLTSPSGYPLRPFGLNLPANWSLSLIWRYDSGVPYTPYSREVVETFQKWNQATTTYRMRTDMKFTKGFRWVGAESQLFIEFINVFDQRNLNPEFGFNRNTGRAFEVGDQDPSSGNVISYSQLLPHLDPRRYYPGFHVQLGIYINL